MLQPSSTTRPAHPLLEKSCYGWVFTGELFMVLLVESNRKTYHGFPAKAFGIVDLGIQVAKGLRNERKRAVNDLRFRALQHQPWPGS